MNSHQIIIEKLASMSGTDPEDWVLVSRARHAMEVVARTIVDLLGEGEGITQAFTCATAVNPLIAGGLLPIYADIDIHTLSADPRSVKKLASSKTRLIMAQHTLGLRANTAALRKIADEYGALLVEDSAHTLGRVDIEHADVSLHSFGAEKMLSTSFGGAVWVNPKMKHTKLRSALMSALSSLPDPRAIDTIRYALYPLLNKLTNRLPFGLSTGARSMLSANKLMITPILPQETHGQNALRPTKLSDMQAKRVVKSLIALERTNKLRKAVAEIYNNELQENQLYINSEDVYVRYPVLLEKSEDSEAIFAQLRADGYTVGKWYRPLFFPGVQADAYNYTKGSCPVAEEASRRIINLPTTITIETAHKLLHEFIGKRTTAK